MKQKAKDKLNKALDKFAIPSAFVNRNTGFLILVVLLLGVPAIIDFQSENQTLLSNTNTTVSQLKKVLCEDIPDEQCNLSQAVAKIKADHDQQDKFIACLLALHGEHTMVVEEVVMECKAISEDSAPANHGETAPVGSGSSSTGTNKDQGSNQPSTNNPPNNPPEQPENPEQPKLLDCKIDLLGLHIGCP